METSFVRWVKSQNWGVVPADENDKHLGILSMRP